MNFRGVTGSPAELSVNYWQSGRALSELLAVRQSSQWITGSQMELTVNHWQSGRAYSESLAVQQSCQWITGWQAELLVNNRLSHTSLLPSTLGLLIIFHLFMSHHLSIQSLPTFFSPPPYSPPHLYHLYTKFSHTIFLKYLLTNFSSYPYYLFSVHQHSAVYSPPTYELFTNSLPCIHQFPTKFPNLHINYS